MRIEPCRRCGEKSDATYGVWFYCALCWLKEFAYGKGKKRQRQV